MTDLDLLVLYLVFAFAWGSHWKQVGLEKPDPAVDRLEIWGIMGLFWPLVLVYISFWYLRAWRRDLEKP